MEFVDIVIRWCCWWWKMVVVTKWKRVKVSQEGKVGVGWIGRIKRVCNKYKRFNW